MAASSGMIIHLESKKKPSLRILNVEQAQETHNLLRH